MLTRVRVAYLLLFVALVATIALPLGSGNPSALIRLLEEPSLLQALWERRPRIVMHLAIMYVYTWPLYLVALLLYIYAPDAQKPQSPRLRGMVKTVMVTLLAFTPVVGALFFLAIAASQ